MLSGLLQGWASAMKNPKELTRIMNDMLEYSKKLAKLGGVVLKNES